jgi:hypothetical protein
MQIQVKTIVSQGSYFSKRTLLDSEFKFPHSGALVKKIPTKKKRELRGI